MGFWMMLLSGRKLWRFFSHLDLVNLYSTVGGGHFFPDTFDPQPDKYPLLKYAVMYEGVQEEGDLMFIPGGNPHAVKNLQNIHAISMNYVDATNLGLHLWSLMENANWGDFELYTDNVTVPHGLRSDQEGLSWGDWKSTDWRRLHFDIH